MGLTEKGRRYVLTADTSQLEAAFRRASAAMNDSMKNIRQLGRALKIDPTNINALRQQQLNYNNALHAGTKRAQAMGRQISDLQKLRDKAFSSGNKKDMDDFLNAGGDSKLRALNAQQTAILANNERLRENLNKTNKDILNNSFNKAFKNIDADLRSATENARRFGQTMKFDKTSMVGMSAQVKELDKAIASSTEKVKLYNRHFGEMANLRRQAAAGDSGAQRVFDTMGGEKAFSKLKVEVAEARAELKKLEGEANNVRKTMSNFNFNTKFDQLSAGVKEATNNMRQLKSIMNNGVTLSGLKMEFREVGIAADLTKQKVKALEAEIRQMNRLRSLGSKGDAGAMADFNLKGGEAQLRSLRIELEKTSGEMKQFKQQATTLGQSIGNFKLDQQLEKANQEIKEATANVKQLSAAMNVKGFNGGDAALRFRELNRAIEQSEQKIKLLNQQRVNVKVNSGEFIRLTNEINKAEMEVKELIASMSALERYQVGGLRGLTGGWQNASQASREFLRNARQTGMEATMSMTMPIAFGAQAVSKAYGEMDTTIRRVATASSSHSGEFAGNFNRIQEAAQNASKGSIYSTREIAAGYESLVKANWTLEEAMAHGHNAMTLSTLAGVENGQAAMMLTDVLSAFGAKADEAGSYVDIMNTAANKSTTDVGQLYETFTAAAPAARSLGLGVKDVAAASILMGNAGIKSAKAGTALFSGLQRLASDDGAKNALKSIGVEAFDANGKMKPLPQVLKDINKGLEGLTNEQRTEKLKDIFGGNHSDAWGAMLEQGLNEINKAEQAVANIQEGNAKEQANYINSGPEGDMKRIAKSWEDTKAKLGEAAWPGIETLTSGVIKLADGFTKLPDPVKKFAVAGLLGAAAFGPLAMAIGWGLRPARLLFDAFKGGSNILKGLKAGKAIKDLFNLGKSAKGAGDAMDKAGKMFDRSSGRMKKSSGGLGRTLARTFQGLGRGIATAVRGMATGVSRMFTAAARGISTVAKGILSGATQLIRGVSSGISTVVRGLGQGLKSTFQGVGSMFHGLGRGVGAAASGIGQGVGSAFRGIGQGAGQMARGVGQGLGATFRGVGQGIGQIARGVGQGVGAAFRGVGQAARGAGQGIGAAAKGIGQGLKAAFQGVGTVIESIGKSIGFAARGIGEGLRAMFMGVALVNPATMLAFAAAILAVGAAIALVLTQSDGIVAIIKQIGDSASQMADTMTNAFIRATPSIVTLINTIKDAIIQVIPVVANGITQIITAIANGASQIAGAISTVISSIAGGISQVIGSLSGLVGSISGLVNSIAGVITATGGAIKAALEGLGSAFEGFGNGVKSALEGVGTVVESTGNAIKSGLEGVSQVIESVGNAIKSALEGAADVIRSVGESAEKAGNGFRLFSEGMKQLSDIGAWDIGTTLASVATGLGKINAEKDNISNVSTSLNQLKDSMNGIQNVGASFGSSLTSMGTALSTLKTNVEQIPTALQNAATGFTTFSTNATQLGSSLTQIGSQIQQFTQGIVQAMTGLTAGTAAMTMFNTSIMMLGTGLMMAGTAVTMFGTAMTMMTASLTMANAALTMFSAAFTAMTASITAANATITMLTASITQLAAQLTSIGASAMTVTASLTAMVASMTMLTATTTAAGASMMMFGTSLMTLTAGLTGASMGVTMFGTAMTMMTASLTMATGALTMFSASFMGVNMAISAAAMTVSSLGMSLSSLVMQFTSVSTAAMSVTASVTAMAAAVTASFATISSVSTAAFAAMVAAAASSMAAMTAAVTAGTAAMIAVMQSFAAQMQALGLQAGTQAAQSTAQGLASGAGAVSSAGMGVLNAARGAMMGVSFVSVGLSITQGIAAGINSGWGMLTSMVASLASSLLAAAKGALGINSPSRKFRDIIGLGIPEGIQVGVDRHKDIAVRSVRNLANATLQAAKGVNIAGRINDSFSSTLATNTSVEHSVRQNSAVVGGINSLIDRINNLELKSDVILSGQKVGEITYKEHQNIERRLAY